MTTNKITIYEVQFNSWKYFFPKFFLLIQSQKLSVTLQLTFCVVLSSKLKSILALKTWKLLLRWEDCRLHCSYWEFKKSNYNWQAPRKLQGIQIWGQQNAAMRTRTHFRTHFVSLVSGVHSKCVRPFFASTESQETKSDMDIALY